MHSDMPRAHLTLSPVMLPSSRIVLCPCGVNLVDSFVTSVEWTLATCKWAHAAQNRFESVMHEHQVVFSMLTTPEERLCVI